ncbi:Nif11-like leader peptide family natural product precursor [Sinorhizobium meliloti]|uniref:Nif11-like leader peptide family natural product precursor n=1 Tax=Rhizobium meliloti TaxID=382 RepID=UPI002072B830|nr:Nif11-like leader peptide family natural product precursor [Sinorhizobium meliloti]MCM5690115.1 Nif11-like leader peptide family natural product precursor [Sinorhizobium meliloti]
MTKADLYRFVDDLEKDGDLLEAVRPKATGLAALVAAANERGYEFTLDEAKAYIQSRSPGDPNVKEVNAVVDGKLKSDVATSTKVFQTAAVATTAVQAVEAGTTVLTAAEAVVTVVVVVV